MSRIAELESFLDERPDDPFLIYALAREYQNQPAGTMKALLMYEHLVTNYPEYTATYYHYALTLYDLGNRTEAIKLLEQGIGKSLIANDHHAASEMKGMLMSWVDNDE